jgi:DNA-binding NarL/FixJ family response regulator
MTDTSKVRLLIVDDHPVVREGLRSMISNFAQIQLVMVCSSGEEALRVACRQPVDVMLIDLRMSPMGGVEVLKRLKQKAPACRGLILSTYELDEEIFQAFEAGARGYLSKDALPDHISKSIELAHAGKLIFSSQMMERIEQRRQRRNLTARELSVLEMVAKGLTNKEIAGASGVSQFTVRNQLSSISSKLDVCDRTEAARVAIEQGIIRID